MSELDESIKRISATCDIIAIIDESKSISSTCLDDDGYMTHMNCLVNKENSLPILKCPNALIHIIIRLLSINPSLLDDAVKLSIADFYRAKDTKAMGLISLENLTALHKTKSPIMTWLKYETLIIYLIKEHIYEPKTMANEILALVKTELEPDIAMKFSSVIKSCVKFCRESYNGDTNEEDEEKWCEIIDWMSWFLATDDGDFL